MSNIAKYVSVNLKFCRSINITQDLGDEEILKGFICPNSFKIAIESIAGNIGTTTQSAFTWTGPYGSGKSSLALILSSLVNKNKKLRQMAKEIIGTNIADDFYAKINVSKGWEVLPVIGEPKSTYHVLSDYLEKNLKKKTDDIFHALESISRQNDGALIILDEMGKCLDAASKGYGDIFFYQQLAEFASRSKGKIIFIGILHQSFADYARYLPHTMRDEWIKVQGRFIDTPINTAGEEQIELIGKAISKSGSYKSLIKDISRITVETISKNKILSSKEYLVEKFCDCWPISPVVVSLLSQISRKKFGQNQRSIFSFLSSGEPKAFRDFIHTTRYADGILYLPADLFDYIHYNLESAILASSDSKLWHIALDAISRVQARGLSELHISILKTIAVIDLFSSNSGLVASADLLKSIYNTNKVQSALADLVKTSVIIFKKHIGAYSIYEGSDFDIEAALEEAYSNITGLEIEKLEEIANFKPVIAKRYYHTFGNMRWFDVIFSPIFDHKSFLEKYYSNSNATGLFAILLPETIEEEKIAEEIVKRTDIFNFPVIMTIAENVRFISEYLKELLSLEWIQKNKSELAGDSIARREVEDRRQIALSLLEVQLNKILLKSKWYYDNDSSILKNNQLSKLASTIVENEYSKSPIIKSELVNRTKPSSSANTAMYALLKRMVMNTGEENLGMKSFTPERGLFNILLLETKTYRKSDDGEYYYQKPVKNNLNYLWKENDKLIKKGKYIDLSKIYDIWEEKPFGIKKGLFSFLALTYILTNRNNIAVYREGVYVSTFNDLFVDYLIKNPKSITLRQIRTNDISHNILVSVIEGINEFDSDKLDLNSVPLLVAQKLVRLIDNLHPWVLKTRTLSPQTTKLRDIIKNASDPHKLLFDDLPTLFGNDKINKYFKTSLGELVEVFPRLIQEIGILMTSELDLPLATPTYLRKLRERAKNIKGISGDYRIEGFAARISTFSSSFNDMIGIISLANNKPQKEWIDLDIENAKKEILYLCNQFKKTELYVKVKNRPATRHGIALIVGIGSKTETVTSEFDILVERQEEVNNLKKDLKKYIGAQYDNSITLSALAELSLEYIRKED
jgi:hypothetical protein